MRILDNNANHAYAPLNALFPVGMHLSLSPIGLSQNPRTRGKMRCSGLRRSIGRDCEARLVDMRGPLDCQKVLFATRGLEATTSKRCFSASIYVNMEYFVRLCC